MKQYRLISEAIYVGDTLWRQVNFSFAMRFCENVINCLHVLKLRKTYRSIGSQQYIIRDVSHCDQQALHLNPQPMGLLSLEEMCRATLLFPHLHIVYIYICTARKDLFVSLTQQQGSPVYPTGTLQDSPNSFSHYWAARGTAWDEGLLHCNRPVFHLCFLSWWLAFLLITLWVCAGGGGTYTPRLISPLLLGRY